MLTRRDLSKMLLGVAAAYPVAAKSLFDSPLPANLHWFAFSDGNPLFPLYGQSGAPCAAFTAILIRHIENGFEGDFGIPGLHKGQHGCWYRINLGVTDTTEVAQKRVDEAVSALSAAGSKGRL